MRTFSRFFTWQVLLVFALGIRLVYLFLLPYGQTPDEIQTFDRIWHTFNGGGTFSYANNMYYYPPLYFYITGAIVKALSFFSGVQSEWTSYTELYLLLRAFSLTLSLTTLFLFWKSTQKLINKQALRLSMFAFACFLPTFATFSIYVNLNILLIFLIQLFWFIFTGNVFQSSTKQIIILSSLTGLAALTKFEGLILIPVLFFITIRQRKKKAFLVFLVLFFFFLCGGWWYFLNLWSLHGIYDKSLFYASTVSIAHPFSFPYYQLTLIWFTFSTFLATFGAQNDLYLADIIYLIFIILLGFAFNGLIRSIEHKGWKVVFSNEYYLGLLIAFLGNLAVYFYLNQLVVYQPQGRYFFPSLLFLSLCFVNGISYYLKNKWLPWLSVGISVFFIFLNVLGFGCLAANFWQFSFPFGHTYCQGQKTIIWLDK